jgi:hypothetical protein
VHYTALSSDGLIGIGRQGMRGGFEVYLRRLTLQWKPKSDAGHRTRGLSYGFWFEDISLIKPQA